VSQNGSFGVVTMLWAGQFGVQFLEGERFFLSPECLDQLQGSHNLIFSGYCGSCPKCKSTDL
jgi:hypothetical protein